MKEKPRVRKWYERERVTAEVGTVMKTKQSFKEQCDINVMMAKWQKKGIMPQVNARTPLYGDFTSAVEFQQAQDKVLRAEQSFNALPAEVRKRVDHDPAKFIEFVTNEENRAELEELGLVVKPAAETPPVGSIDEAGEGESTPSEPAPTSDST